MIQRWPKGALYAMEIASREDVIQEGLMVTIYMHLHELAIQADTPGLISGDDKGRLLYQFSRTPYARTNSPGRDQCAGDTH